MAGFQKLTFVSCCDNEELNIEFNSGNPSNYVNGSTYYYNGNCFTAFISTVSFPIPPIPPPAPIYGGIIIDEPLEDTAYLVSTTNDCGPNNCLENNLVLNGNFDSDLSNWDVSPQPDSWVFESGTARYNGVDEGGFLSQNVFTPGFSYNVSFDICIDTEILDELGNAVYPLVVDVAGIEYSYNDVGCISVIVDIVAVTNVLSFFTAFDGGEDGTYTVDNVCVINTTNDVCPDCNEPISVKDCYYVENCFDASIHFYAIISNPDQIGLGNTYSLDLSNVQDLPIDFNDCWNITSSELCDETFPVIEITAVYESCEDCSILEVPPCFLLIDCYTGESLVYSGDVLNQYINRVIQVNIEGVIRCFTVQTAPCTEESLELVFEHIILDCFDINECLLCLPKPEPIKKPKLRYVQPGYTTALCDPDKVEKIKCTFADLMYQQAMSRRFNIKFCCPKDLGVWQLRHEKINLDLTKFINPTPDPCNPICKTYAFEFAAGVSGNISYLNCSSDDVTVNVLDSNVAQRFEFCALDYPGVTIGIANSLGVVVDTFTIQPVDVICII
jgi:hypothetical protein